MGGIWEAARDTGIAEATYRRRIWVAGARFSSSVHEAIRTAPVALTAAKIQRIFRHMTEGATLLTVKAGIAARLAPKPPGAVARVKARVAEQEAGIAKLRRDPNPGFRKMRVEIKSITTATKL